MPRLPRLPRHSSFAFSGREFVGLTTAVMLSGLSPATIRRLAQRGRIGTLITPSATLYDADDLARLAAGGLPPQTVPAASESESEESEEAAPEEPRAAEEAAS